MKISVLVLLAILTIAKAANDDDCLNAELTAIDDSWGGGASCGDVPDEACSDVCDDEDLNRLVKKCCDETCGGCALHDVIASHKANDNACLREFMVALGAPADGDYDCADHTEEDCVNICTDDLGVLVVLACCNDECNMCMP